MGANTSVNRISRTSETFKSMITNITQEAINKIDVTQLLDISGIYTSGGLKIESITQDSKIEVDVSSALTALLTTENKEVFETELSNTAKTSQKGINWFAMSVVVNNISSEFKNMLEIENTISNKCSNEIGVNQTINISNSSFGDDGVEIGPISQSSALNSTMNCITNTVSNVLNDTTVSETLENKSTIEQAGLLSLSDGVINAMLIAGIVFVSVPAISTIIQAISAAIVQSKWGYDTRERDVQLAQIEAKRDISLASEKAKEDVISKLGYVPGASPPPSAPASSGFAFFKGVGAFKKILLILNISLIIVGIILMIVYAVKPPAIDCYIYNFMPLGDKCDPSNDLDKNDYGIQTISFKDWIDAAGLTVDGEDFDGSDFEDEYNELADLPGKNGKINPEQKDNETYHSMQTAIFKKMSKDVYKTTNQPGLPTFGSDSGENIAEDGDQVIAYIFKGATTSACGSINEKDKSATCFFKAVPFNEKKITLITAKKKGLTLPTGCTEQEQYGQKLFTLPPFMTFKQFTDLQDLPIFDSDGEITEETDLFPKKGAVESKGDPFTYISPKMRMYVWNPSLQYTGENEELDAAGYTQGDNGIFVELKNNKSDSILSLIKNDMLLLSQNNPYKKEGVCELFARLKNNDIKQDGKEWDDWLQNINESKGEYFELFNMGNSHSNNSGMDQCSKCRENVYATFDADTLNMEGFGQGSQWKCEGCGNSNSSLNCPWSVMYYINLDNPSYLEIQRRVAQFTYTGEKKNPNTFRTEPGFYTSYTDDTKTLQLTDTESQTGIPPISLFPALCDINQIGVYERRKAKLWLQLGGAMTAIGSLGTLFSSLM